MGCTEIADYGQRMGMRVGVEFVSTARTTWEERERERARAKHSESTGLSCGVS